jgi:LysR family glycine cleavage system transcriptional activator
LDTTRGPAFNDHGNAIQAAIDGQGVALGRTALVGGDLLATRFSPMGRRRPITLH